MYADVSYSALPDVLVIPPDAVILDALRLDVLGLEQIAAIKDDVLLEA
jgi:hypothetical protein